MFNKQFITTLFFSIFFIALSTFSNASEQKEATEAVSKVKENGLATILKVYKTPSCMCCLKWVDHIEENGFKADIENKDEIFAYKSSLGIDTRFHSCHTGITDEGYVFEGHVPVRYMKQYMENPPKDTIGLSVPGMVVGSPGMERGDKIKPYEVLLLHKDGTSSVYAEVTELQ